MRHEYSIGDWVESTITGEYFQVGRIDLDLPEWSLMRPILITPEILLRNGFEKKHDIYVLKNENARLGWKPDGTFILGYSLLPTQILHVHKLQHIYDICGIKDEIVLEQ